MNKLLSDIRKMYAHYQSKLLVAFLICTFLPVALIATISYKASYDIAKKQILNAAYFSSNQINAQINSRISQAENVSDALQYDMYSLIKSENFDTSKYIKSFEEARNSIDLYKSSFSFFHIYAFLKDGQMGSEESVYFFPLSDLAKWGISEEELSRLGTDSLWFHFDNLSLPSSYSSSNIPEKGIACCRAQFNQSAQSPDYAFIILINSETLENYMSFPDSSPMRTYILSENGSVVVSSSKTTNALIDYGKAQQIAATNANILDEGGYTFICLPLSNGWCQVTEIPTDYIFKSTLGIIKRILITLLVFIPFTLITIFYNIRKLSYKINALSKAMNNYTLQESDNNENSLIYEMPDNAIDYDEIDTLCISFENMQHSIKENLTSIVNYKIKEERLKYQLLQSQINPHFLYNILGSIKYCQSLGKLDEASQMLTDLTRFYRLSLRKSGELITLRDELEIAESYLRIEKLCQRGEITWSIDLEDGIENFSICKFTLQPFLENAILHGINKTRPNINISISACYGDSTVIVTIHDTGCGIEPAKLNEIKRDISDRTVNYTRHFGISNVNARISNPYYGNGSIEVESIVGEGTTVRIEYDQIEIEETNV